MSASTLVVIEAGHDGGPGIAAGLLPLGGVPALELQIRRLARLRQLARATIVVATSELPVDDPVAAVAERCGAAVVRAAPGDVVGRYAIALVRYGDDHLVRLRDDAPLSDPHLVLAAIDLHRSSAADLTTNVLPRSYPRGLEIEVVSARALRSAALEASDPIHRRRWTEPIARHPERFRLATIRSGHDLSAERWSLRSPSDAVRLQELLVQVPDAEGAGWDRVLSVVGRSAGPRPGDLRLVPDPPPAPGSDPWVRSWAVIVDAEQMGTVAVSVTAGAHERSVAVREPWVEPARVALHELLLDDLQVRR